MFLKFGNGKKRVCRCGWGRFGVVGFRGVVGDAT